MFSKQQLITYSDKFLGLIVMVAILNFFFLISYVIFAGEGGNLILEGQLTPEHIFESEFVLKDTKDLSFIFETYSSSTFKSEILNITLLYPNGDVFSYQKEFHVWDEEPGIKTDYTMVFKPQAIGKYHIKITGTKFLTNLRLKSGISNVHKNPLIFTAIIIIWFFIGLAASRLQSRLQNTPRPSITPSKIEVLITLLISLITTYFALYSI